MPTDWVRTRHHHLLAESQVRALQAKLSSELNEQTTIDAATFTSRSWYSLTRQIYAAIAAQSRSSRVDMLNGNYSLNRGIASALLIGMVLLLFIHGFIYWQTILIILVSVGVALYRMHRFGVLYAREVFVQFLQLPKNESSTTPPMKNSKQAGQSEIVSPEN